MTQSLGIGLIGAAGRVGQEIVKAVTGRSDIHVASALEREGSTTVGQDVAALAGCAPSGVLVDTILDRVVAAADVVVDLSSPLATEAVIRSCVAAKKPLLSGTTGVGSEVLKLFDAAARDIPVIYASNLSPGIALLESLVLKAASALKDGYDIEIVEMHHRNKVDAPSGTALTLAEAAAEARGLCLKDALRNGRAGHTGARSTDEIGMHALRGGGVFGDHTVVLASDNERIELTHRASSRALFAQGAIRGALFLANQKPGRYTMREALGL